MTYAEYEALKEPRRIEAGMSALQIASYVLMDIVGFPNSRPVSFPGDDQVFETGTLMLETASVDDMMERKPQLKLTFIEGDFQAWPKQDLTDFISACTWHRPESSPQR